VVATSPTVSADEGDKADSLRSPPQLPCVVVNFAEFFQ
jgi:hypothetical protein